MSRVRILLVDDHAILRESLRMLISWQPDLSVVGEACDVRQALDQIQALAPDLLVLDLSLPGGGGGRVLDQLPALYPACRALILTMHTDPSTVRAMLALGAYGYVAKTSTPAVLLQGIRTVARGSRFIDPCLRETEVPTRSVTMRPASLSERETQILRLLARGCSHAQIAGLLFLSPKTVETYRTRLSHKLGLRHRADLVQYALAAGLLDDVPAPESSAPQE